MVPILPPAPGRLSTMKGCPIDFAIRSSRMRMTTSLALPPANGTITWIGRVGNACADAVTGAANSPTAAAATCRRRERRMDFPRKAPMRSSAIDLSIQADSLSQCCL
jgi:hypothetical protein